MAIKKSISGMRGTIGGAVGDNLTPLDIVEMTAAYAKWVLGNDGLNLVVLGRDGRISGLLVSNLVTSTLQSMGIDVVDLGYSTTPTVEMAVPALSAGGGIICTASHNPMEWNALKLLNAKGEFISKAAGESILKLATERDFYFAKVDNLGRVIEPDRDFIQYHIDKILALDVIDVESIKKSGFSVVVDCINSTGAISIPPLLDALNVKYTLINEEMTGVFAHDPEPVPKNLHDLASTVSQCSADLGIAVDPDVDRLVLVCEDGSMFSEENTVVAAADLVLNKTPGPTVTNLSSSRAMRDITQKYACNYYAAAVGEVNVVNMMKEVNAIIGGEGNGGVIYPTLHAGRDALLGIAMVLSLLSERKINLSSLKKSYPSYTIIKEKLSIKNDKEVDEIISKVRKAFAKEDLNEIDGLKVDFENGWVHIRSSNTEPIIRVIAESNDASAAKQLINKVINLI